MARFYGEIGFAINTEVRPGIYKEVYKERPYKGTVTKKSRRWDPTDYLNDELSISNEISIVADSFAVTNFGVMRYIRWMNQTFEIASATIDVDVHRINLSLGGVFNVPDDGDRNST